jgi:ADP-heptose:LPS heptosyltransferase
MPVVRALAGWRYRSSKVGAAQAPVRLDQFKRILLLRLDEIGDMMLTSPLLRELRRNLPQARITLVVKPGVHNLVALCPYVDEVLTFDWHGYGFAEPFQRHWRAITFARRFLRNRHFELAILPRWDIDWYHGTMLSYLSGATKRVGFSEQVNSNKKRFNRGFDRLLTDQFGDSGMKHDAQHSLDVIGFLGGRVCDDRLELWVGPEDEMFADELLRHRQVSSTAMIVALGIGAGLKKRQWPWECYGQIGRWLQREFDARIIVIGGPQDRSAGGALQNFLGKTAIDITGTTTLRQTAAVLKRCALYAGNDAGPMHIAAAAQIPVVEISCHPKSGSLWSANSPLRFGPWGTRAAIIQPANGLIPCTEECNATVPHCILGIDVQQVKEVLTAMLSREELICRNHHGDSIHTL